MTESPLLTFPAGDGSPPTVRPSLLTPQASHLPSIVACSQTPTEWCGIDLDDFPHLEKWLYKLLERPGFEAGRNVPTPHTAFENNKLTEKELEAKAVSSKAWIQAGMKEDAKK